VIITVSGVVAYQSPDQIPGAVRAAIVRWAPQAVLLDIADVSALDAASITALLASHQTGERAGIPVSLINVGPFLLGQLREIGLASLLRPLSSAHDGAAVSADSCEPHPWSTAALKSGR
jgi:anti-anti-sigma regulatory factor